MKLSDIFSEAFAEKDTGKVFKNIISILSRRTGENFSGQPVPIPVISGGKKLWTLLYLSDNKGIRFNWASKDTSNQITSITVWPSAKSAPIVSKDSLSGLNLIQIVNLASQMLKGETGEVEVEDAESEKMAAVNEALDVITEASLKEKAKKYAKKKAKEKEIIDRLIEEYERYKVQTVKEYISGLSKKNQEGIKKQFEESLDNFLKGIYRESGLESPMISPYFIEFMSTNYMEILNFPSFAQERGFLLEQDKEGWKMVNIKEMLL